MNEEKKQIILKNLAWLYLIFGLGLIWGGFRVLLASPATILAISKFIYPLNMSPTLGAIISILLGLGLLLAFFGLQGKRSWGRLTALWIGLAYILWALVNGCYNIFINGNIVVGIVYLLFTIGFTYGAYFLIKGYPR